MKKYERLDAWQAAYRVVLGVYEATRGWPREELYGMTPQIRRAAVSVVANIAEGVGRRGPRELRRFIDIAAGSQVEVTCLVRLAGDLGYPVGSLPEQCQQAARLLWALRRSLAGEI